MEIGIFDSVISTFFNFDTENNRLKKQIVFLGKKDYNKCNQPNQLQIIKNNGGLENEKENNILGFARFDPFCHS